MAYFVCNTNVVNEYWITLQLSGIVVSIVSSTHIFSVLKKIVEYSQVKVISKDLVNIFFNIDFKCFLIFKPSVYVFSHLLYIQILMYGNLDFLVKALSVVGVLYVSVLMSLFIFRQKIIAISRPKR